MTPHTRLIRHFAPLAAVLTATALLPATALAGNSPLLSGYASPGSGEQTILGGGVVGGGSGGSGGGGSNATQSLAVNAATSGSAPSTSTGTSSATNSTSSAGTLKSTPDRKKPASSTSQHKSTRSTGSSSSSSNSTSTTAVTRPGAPAVVAYRNSSGSVGSFPLTAGDVLIALLGLLAVVLAALGLRMVMGDGRDGGPPISQVAVR